MRLKTVTAADGKAALAEIRAALGPDAVLVLSQPLSDGRVRVTAAVDDDDPDLDAVLAPAATQREASWFRNLADHHGMLEPMRGRLGELVGSLADAEPCSALAQALQSRFRFRPCEPDSRQILLLSGPPGVGKTTTIAKLAARAALAGRKVRVISTDVDRAGGLEPLRALLAPLELRPEAAPAAGPFRSAAVGESDLILIDTPAINPFRSRDVARLSQAIERSGTPPVLILSAGYDPGDARDIAETYAALGADRMIATKLDVARRFGGLLAAADAGLALTEAGIAPTVGGGLRPLTARGLARLLLHGQLRTPAKRPGAER